MLKVNCLSHSYGNKLILNEINLEIPFGQFISLVGPSGCGKSTLLKCMLGTLKPTIGNITLVDKLVNKPTRDIGIVYQHYSLYDFLTTEENVAFGLNLEQTSFLFRLFGGPFWKRIKNINEEKAKKLLIDLGLKNAIGLYPSQLSGGMKQRVAIGQAIIMQPKILLLDEPFGALDEATREDLQNLMISFYNINKECVSLGKTPPYTVIIVTHELNEAIYLSDRIVGLSQYNHVGNGAKIVYDKPATAFDKKSDRDYSLFLKQKQEIREIVFND